MKNWKGTKGNWVVKKNSSFYEVALKQGDHLPLHGIVSVFENEHIGIDEEVAEANANLIAEAPKMLEVLLSLENDNGTIPKNIWDMRNKAIENALK